MIEITVKYSAKCIECDELIPKGVKAFWIEGIGIQHLTNECIIGFRDDNSRLVIIDEKDEDYLLDNYNIRPGELRAKMDIADWLLYASSEICRILHYQYLNKEITKLRLRLKHGIKEELLPLVKMQGIGRIRARRLYSNKNYW